MSIHPDTRTLPWSAIAFLIDIESALKSQGPASLWIAVSETTHRSEPPKVPKAIALCPCSVRTDLAAWWPSFDSDKIESLSTSTMFEVLESGNIPSSPSIGAGAVNSVATNSLFAIDDGLFELQSTVPVLFA
jgi:hypothetical protein